MIRLVRFVVSLVAAVLVCSVPVWAQITITRAQFPDSANYTTPYLTTAADSVVLGTTGGDQRWDFSTVSQFAYPVDYTDISPDSTPITHTHNWGSNRLASVSQEGILFGGGVISLPGMYSYFRYGTNTYEMIGVYVPADTVNFPAHPAQTDSITTTYRLANFPLSYNQTWTDSLKTTVTLTDTVVLGSAKHRRLRVLLRSVNTIDSYGTLLYPGDSVQALRMVTVTSGGVAYDLQVFSTIYLTLITIPIPTQTTVSYVAQNVGPLVTATSDTGVTTPDFTFAASLQQSARHYNPTSVSQPTVRFSLPSSLQISAFPNPFNPATRLTFASPVGGKASLVVYNVLGRRVAELYNGSVASGQRYNAQWGSNLPAGSYFARFTVNGMATTTRLERLP